MRCFTIGYAVATVLVVRAPLTQSIVVIAILLLVCCGITLISARRNMGGERFCRELFSSGHYSVTLCLGVTLGTVMSVIVVKGEFARQLPEEQNGIDLLLTGQIVSIPKTTDRSTRFLMQVETGEPLDAAPSRQSVALRDMPEQVLLSWYGHGRKRVEAGQTWTLVARLKSPQSLGNPGGFDYAAWLFYQRVHATGYVRDKPAPVLLSSGQWHLHRFRQSVASRLADLPNANAFAALVQGLTVGVTNDIADEHWQSLRNSGTAHLLAISGLHVGLVSVWFYALFNLLWLALGTLPAVRQRFLVPRQVLAWSGGLFGAVLYSALAGFSLPTQRALVMLCVFISTIAVRRVLPSGSALCIALLLVLLIEPLVVISVGFWLSFGTVACLLYLHLGRLEKSSRTRAWWLHVKLGLILLPMTAWFFQQGALIAPVANALAVPLVGLVVVPLSFLCVVSLTVSASLANVLLSLVQWLLGKLLQLLDVMLTLPLSSIPLSIPNKPLLLFVVMGLLLLFAPRGLCLRWLAVPLIAPAIVMNLLGKPVRGLELHVLDVGQGLSAVIFTEHHTVVFDTGKRLSQHSSMAERVLLPFLLSRGRTKVDAAVISHADDDHAGGLGDLLQAQPRLTVYASDEKNLVGDSPQRCSAGKSFRFDNTVFTFLHPAAFDHGSRNNLSCVLLIRHGRTSVLLTGDIEASAERQLVNRLPAALAVDVLIAPHHGSRSSSSAAFLSMIKPSHVIFPAGRNNKFGFPHDDVRRAYEAMGASTYTVGESGALRVRMNEAGLIEPVQAYWQTHRRFGG